MVAGIILGTLLNLFATDVPWVQQWLTGGLFYVGGKIFISCLKLLVVPLVLVSLICGTAALDDVRKVGTVGIRTVVLYLVTTAIAITLALTAATLFKPGLGIDKDKFLNNRPVASSGTEQQLRRIAEDISEVKRMINQLAEKTGEDSPPFEDIEAVAEEEASAPQISAPPFTEVLINIFPSNPFESMASGNMLQVIVFSILFGLALTVSGEPGQRVLSVVQDLNEVVMQLILMLMRVAPYGVFCLITQTFASQGFAAIAPLSKYFFLVILVLLIHASVVYPIFLRVLAGLNPVKFLKKMWQTQMFAFSTSSSNATIPVTMETTEEKLGVHQSISAFTVPLGATINMDGTAIMQGVATVFIAQAWGIDLTLVDFLIVIATATLASIGTAGVPSVGLIMLSMVLLQVGLPVDGIAIILGVDRILDMIRTAVNVTGDAMVTCIVGKWQGEMNTEVFDSED